MHRLRDLIGVPFVAGGRDPKVGLDCLGMVRIAVKRLKNAEVSKDYLEESSTEDILNFRTRSMEDWEPISEPEIGCAVAMRLDPERPDFAQHLGVYIGEGYILHTIKKMGVHRISINDPYFHGKIEGFYRWKK